MTVQIALILSPEHCAAALKLELVQFDTVSISGGGIAILNTNEDNDLISVSCRNALCCHLLDRRRLPVHGDGRIELARATVTTSSPAALLKH